MAPDAQRPGRTALSRRSILAGAVSMSVCPAPAIARGTMGDPYLGKAWRLPPGETVAIVVEPQQMTLKAALMAIDDWTFPASARLVFRLADGEHPLDGTLVISHGAGQQISILGSGSSRCRIVAEGPHDLIYVGQGRSLGFIDRLTLAHAAPTKRGAGSGLLADEGGVILSGRDLKVRQCYYGITARRNGVIRADGTECSEGGDANYFAVLGGQITAQGSIARSANDITQRLGSGFVAEYGGTIDCARSTASLNWLAGYTALSGGSIRAYDTVATENGHAGYLARSNGVIVAHNGQARANCRQSILAQEQGSIVGSRLESSSGNSRSTFCSSF